MKVGFIGAGKAGCSLGKYFATENTDVITVSGYYSKFFEEAQWAANFTVSKAFSCMEDVIAVSDSIILSTSDGEVSKVWDAINKNTIKGKIICHLSGSLSSDVFSGMEEYGAYPISIHPMFAFSNKESVYVQLKNVSFTLEGHEEAVQVWQEVFSRLGNQAISIAKEVKPKYHAAASLLSNHVIAILHAGYTLLEECGFSKEEARQFSKVLVQDNLSHVIKEGTIGALTGPIERGDVKTIQKHLAVMGKDTKELYRTCGGWLLAMAREKNPQRDYTELEAVLNMPEGR